MLKLCSNENLDEPNKFYCKNCAVPTKSTKKLRLYRLPKILILHLKRFTNDNSKLCKLDNVIGINGDLDFDKLKICHKNSLGSKLYNLFGIVNHFGSLESGHYTSECRSLYDNSWYNFNDSNYISCHSPEYVTSTSVYLLFYRRAN